MEFRVLAIGLLALLGCIEARVVETIYEYTGDVRAGSNFPAQFASQFGIKASLKTLTEDGSKAILQFSDISYQVSTGPLADQEFPQAQFIPAPAESDALKEPFQVIYESGKVKAIQMKDEPMWSKNIKKSVAALFQLDVPHLHFNAPYSFVTDEETVYGKCRVGYTVNPKGDGHVDLLKNQEYSKCENIPYRYYTNGIYNECPNCIKEDSLLQGSTKYYKLYMNKHKLEIKEIFSQSVTAAVPFHGGSDDQTILVRQNITFVSSGFVKESMKFKSKEEMKRLKYEIPNYYNDVGTFSDMTGGRDIKSKDELMELAHKTLGEQVDFMEDLKLTKEPEKLDSRMSQRLVFYLGQLDQECLMHCFEKYMTPKTYREKNLRGAFLEVAAQVGTKASILFVRDAIINRKVPEALAIEVLRLVPFYIRDPSVELLKEFETLLDSDVSKSIRKTAILSISNMVFLVYKQVHDVELINNYADKFYQSFKDAEDYGTKLNYLSALANLEEGKVFNYLSEIVKENTYSHNLRYQALWGTRAGATKEHIKGYELYWPIFSNRDIEIDMRAAAMKLIMITEPTFDRFLSIFWFMQAEMNSQLYYYFYTGIESLSNTHHPCYKTIGHHAERMFRYAKKPITSYLFTGDYVMDYIDTKHDLGGHTKLSLIGDSKTGAPNTIFMSQGGYMGGYNHNYFGVLVKVNGLTEYMKNEILDADKDELKMADLGKILSLLQIKTAKQEAIYVEVVYYTSERVVETIYYDGSDTDDSSEETRDFSGRLKSWHNFIFAGVHEYVQPTDIGIPAIWNLAVPYSLTITSNISYDIGKTRWGLKTAFALRYGRYGGHSLSFYNPLGGMWQGAYRTHSHMYTVPMYKHLTFDLEQKQIKLAIVRGPQSEFNLGFAYHTQTQVFATDYAKSNALHESCPACLQYVTVRAPGKASRDYNIFSYDSSETGLEYKLDVFDCDQPHTPYDLASILYEAFENQDLNYGHNPFGRILFGARKLHTYLGFQPNVGSCGLIFNALPSKKYPYTQLEGVLQLTTDDDEKDFLEDDGTFTLHGSISLKGDDPKNVHHTYEIVAGLEITEEHLKNKFDLEVTRTTPNEKDFKYCMNIESKYPEAPLDEFILRKNSDEDVNGKLSITWGVSSAVKCPVDGSGIEVTMKAGVMHNDDQEHSEYPYSECHRDAQKAEWKGKSFTPITYACFLSALDATTLRKYSGEMKYSNIPEKFVNYGSTLMNLMKTAGQLHLMPYEEKKTTYISNKSTFADPHNENGKHGEMKYLVEFEKNKPYMDLQLSWEGYDQEQHYSMNYDVFGFKPLLTSSRFSPLKRAAYESGFISSCVVTPSSVLTLDNDTYHYHSSNCYTLVSADCTENPTYAIFTKKVDGPYDLAVKFYSGGNYIEIVPNAEGHFEVNINGEQIPGGLKNGYRYPEEGDDYYFKINHSDGFVNIDTEISYVDIDYTGYTVIAHVHALLRGSTCGLCGDFNGDDVYYERMGKVSHDCHNSHYDALAGDYIGYRYTLRDEACPEITEEMTKHLECTEHHH